MFANILSDIHQTAIGKNSMLCVFSLKKVVGVYKSTSGAKSQDFVIFRLIGMLILPFMAPIDAIDGKFWVVKAPVHPIDD